MDGIGTLRTTGGRVMAAASHLLGVHVARWSAAGAAVLLASALTLLLPRGQLFPLMTWICWAHVVAACLLLPARTGIWLFVLAVGLSAFLVVVNSLKVGLTGLPLTMLDLRIAVANPGGLWDSLNLPNRLSKNAPDEAQFGIAVV